MISMVMMDRMDEPPDIGFLVPFVAIDHERLKKKGRRGGSVVGPIWG
jgi:hypothetical protein